MMINYRVQTSEIECLSEAEFDLIILTPKLELRTRFEFIDRPEHRYQTCDDDICVFSHVSSELIESREGCSL